MADDGGGEAGSGADLHDGRLSSFQDDIEQEPCVFAGQRASDPVGTCLLELSRELDELRTDLR